jgi:hypothetical protein
MLTPDTYSLFEVPTMVPYDAPTYRRARDAGHTAKNALALARWIAAPKIELPDYGRPVTIERDGWTITLAADYDGDMSLADLGYGRFLAGVEDWRSGHEQRPEPDAIPNPYRDSRNVSGGDGWYVPGEAGSLAERADYLHKAGASKSVALDEARAMLAEEVRYVTRDYGPSVYVLTATASRKGIRLGTASVGGIEIAWNDITRTSGMEYLAEVAEDIIPEAIAEAEAALERLVTA